MYVPIIFSTLRSTDAASSVVFETLEPCEYTIIQEYFKDVSREFDEVRVNTHLCKLRCWYL